MATVPPMPSDNRSVSITFRITPQGARKIEELRGTWSQSEYIRQALRYVTKSNPEGKRTTLHGPQ